MIFVCKKYKNILRLYYFKIFEYKILSNFKWYISSNKNRIHRYAARKNTFRINKIF